MKTLICSLFIFLICSTVKAETVYVTDDLEFTLRSLEHSRSKILKILRSGTPLTFISQNKATGYSKVRTEDGTVGYILTRYTTPKPIHRTLLEEAKQKIAALQKESAQRNPGGDPQNPDSDYARFSYQELKQQKEQFSNELNELKQTAANAIQLKHQRDQLQERVIAVERELQQLKRENQALEDSANQDWFLYGGIVSLFGVVLGFILPKLSWRRKSGNWDTF